MEIELKKISVRELTNGYVNDQEEGVRGYGGKLDIRPPYQREFIYKDEQRDAVIDTILKGYPLNVMYWAVRGDGTYEVIDGQQRTISISDYVRNDFSFKKLSFHNLPPDKQAHILDYELTVYLCEGEASEKLEWFKTINIAGEELTNQELRNAVYNGPWVSSAKKYFSKSGCPAYGIGSKYLNGSAIRQDYFETAIRWISKDGDIEGYMDKNRREPNADELWLYFKKVIDWVQVLFSNHRKEMKGIAWGLLYNEFGDKKYDSEKLEEEIKKLMLDDDVTRKSGIYEYVFKRERKYLSLRAFSEKQRRAAYEKKKGICTMCGKEFPYEEMEADHIVPWVKGGRTIDENCQMLCKKDNREKSSKG